MIFLKILSILSQTYTLPPLRDDLAVLQHQPCRIETPENPSYLAKRSFPIANMYYDKRGHVKVIFKVQATFAILSLVGRSSMGLAQCILSECQLWMLNAPRPDVLAGAVWAAQVGSEWPGIIERSFGDGTMAILLTLRPLWLTQPGVDHVLGLLQQWFGRIGYDTTVDLVSHALDVCNARGNPVQGNSITERQTFGDLSDSKYCKAPIQNWPFVFMPGEMNVLLPPVIRC